MPGRQPAAGSLIPESWRGSPGSRLGRWLVAVPGGACRADRVAVCHRKPAFASIHRRFRWAGLVLVAAWLAMAGQGCGSDPAPFYLPPLGASEAEVGLAWERSLEAIGEVITPLTWRVVMAPPGLGLITDAGGADSARARLIWVPDAFALGPNPPGTPRIASKPHPIVIEAHDAAGRTATSTGSVVVTPSTLADGIEAADDVWLNLDASRAGRWPVRTDTTALLGAPIALVAPAPTGAELVELSKGSYVLRYRPDDADLADERAVEFVFASPGVEAPIALHTLRVHLQARDAASACLLAPPHPRVELPTSATTTTLAGAVAATDLDSRARSWLVRAWSSTAAFRAGSAANLQVTGGAPPQGNSAPFSLIAPGSLVALQVEVDDLDDPFFGRCAGRAVWPTHGAALVGIGSGCVDDGDAGEATALAARGPAWLARHCPGAADERDLIVASSESVRVIADTPDGWPPVAIEVRDANDTICLGHSAGAPCDVPASAAPRTLRIRVTADAATSSSIRVVLGDVRCGQAVGAAPIQLLESQGWYEGLACPGEWLRFERLGTSGEPVGFDLRNATAALVVLGDPDGTTPVRFASTAGATHARLAGVPGETHVFAVQPLGNMAVSLQIRAATGPATAAWRDDPLVQRPAGVLWLPQAFGLWLSRPPGMARALAVALPAAAAGGIRALPAAGLDDLVVGEAPATDVETADGISTLAAVSTGVASPEGTLPLIAPPQSAASIAFELSVPDQGAAAIALFAEAGPPAPCGPDRYDTAPGSAPTQLGGADGQRARTLAGLGLCPGAVDRFVLQLPRDALLECATSSQVASPPIRVIGPGLQGCAGPPPPQGGWDLAPAGAGDIGLVPPHRRSVSCWLLQEGAHIIEVGPLQAETHYDLSWRVR